MDTQAFKRSLHHSERYNRRGFESPTKRAQALEKAYQSDLIASIRDNGYLLEHGRIKVKLAEAFAHFDLFFVKPLDEELLHKVFRNFASIIIFEEGVKHGGVGSAILEFAARHNYHVPVKLEGVSDDFVSHGIISNAIS